MNLLVLMYHRARAGRHGNSPAVLDEHFAFLADRYPHVLPGDSLAAAPINVCLSFDDGYFDFYSVVFPLLKKHRLRALLAVPPKVILDRVGATTEARLKVEIEEAFAQPEKGGFCTWSELEEMAHSGHVAIAAHGLSHVRLDQPDADLADEIDAPQEILRARTGRPVDSFVFPFGRFSDVSLRRTKDRYRHVFRIGGAQNRGWDGRVLYRVDADCMESPRSVLAPARLLRYRARQIWNQVRGR